MLEHSPQILANEAKSTTIIIIITIITTTTTTTTTALETLIRFGVSGRYGLSCRCRQFTAANDVFPLVPLCCVWKHPFALTSYRFCVQSVCV